MKRPQLSRPGIAIGAAVALVAAVVTTVALSTRSDDVAATPAAHATPQATTTTTSAPPNTTATTSAAPTTTTSTRKAPPAAPAPQAAASCKNPAFSTAESDDGWSDGDYYVHNNMWNAADYTVSQKLVACSAENWSVTTTADNDNGDGAVKTYPNVHKDYHDWGTDKEPPLRQYSRLMSTFGATSPHTGIYNVAYDIWLNGVPGNREIMIWTDNNGQTPSGDLVAGGLSFSGKTWDLYATDDNEYLAFIPSRPMTKGTLNLKAFLDYLVKNGRVPANSTLGQICFGVAVVSTDGKPATFRFTDFSVTD
jgi:glycosyl hydrolase family 12